MFVLALLSLSLAATGFAAPHHHGRDTTISGSVLQQLLASNGAALTVPNANANAKFVLVGAGTQNYTCTPAGNFSSIGAVASLFDISGLVNTPNFDIIQDCVASLWFGADNITSASDPAMDSLIASNFQLTKVGEHTFVNFNGNADPNFDFTQSTGDPNEFITAVKAQDVPSSKGANDNVDWLHLTLVNGGAGNDVFRVLTNGGQPSPPCQSGSPPITVKYTSQYWVL